MLVNKATIVSQLAPPLDSQLAQQLVDEFVSQEKRFIQRDWEPSQLDGGQFCEALARIVYHVDSGNLNHTKSVNACLEYVEDEKNQHAMQPRQTALHLAKVTRTAYKFRSSRGAVHITPSYVANHMDSKLVLESVRWLFAETLRIFWRDDRDAVATAIRELLQFDVPAVGRFEDVLLVQRTDLSPSDEILVMLHYAGEKGFSRRELGQYVMHPAPRITEALQYLTGPSSRQVVKLGSGNFRLTDLGSKHIRESLADKLFIS
ncbi:MAG TPA: hypothetical protein VE377_09095 [Candidatus Dormibacteraeota bacterium]|nr:hypothetical protein [Candidatus Dormibacteraeota bacterium]